MLSAGHPPCTDIIFDGAALRKWRPSLFTQSTHRLHSEGRYSASSIAKVMLTLAEMVCLEAITPVPAPASDSTAFLV